jgi:hypothetical protein
VDKKVLCPLMQSECIKDGAIKNGELVACRFWITVQGRHPQTNEVINNQDCSFNWQPILMIENSKVNRETGAAVESLRNENVTTGGQITAALLTVAQQQAPQLHLVGGADAN